MSGYCLVNSHPKHGPISGGQSGQAVALSTRRSERVVRVMRRILHPYAYLFVMQFCEVGKTIPAMVRQLDVFLGCVILSDSQTRKFFWVVSCVGPRVSIFRLPCLSLTYQPSPAAALWDKTAGCPIMQL